MSISSDFLLTRCRRKITFYFIICVRRSYKIVDYSNVNNHLILITWPCADMTVAAVASDEHKNITATVNSNVTLSCSINTANLAERTQSNWTIRWILNRDGSTIPLLLFNGYNANPTFSKFKVNVVKENRYSELTICNIHQRDVGTYACLHSSKSRPVATFTLIVTG